MDVSPKPEGLLALEEKLRLLDGAEHLSIHDALELANEVATLAQDTAASLEAADDLAGAAALYEDVAKALREMSRKVPERDRNLLIPFVDFWAVAASLKRDSLPSVTKSKGVKVPLSHWKRRVSVSTRLPGRIKEALDTHEGAKKQKRKIEVEEEKFVRRTDQVKRRKGTGRRSFS